MSETNPATMAERVALMRSHWSDFAVLFTERINKRRVLEVAAGAGLGSLDALEYLKRGASQDQKKRRFVVTDLAPTMVQLATETPQAHISPTRLVAIQVMEANGQDLVQIESASMDRYMSSLCLQLCPDPDAHLRQALRVLKSKGIVGFTIWGRPEFSGMFSIDAELCKELGMSDGADHPNFAMGKDLVALRQRFAAAGFNKVMIWPFLCVLELWSGDEYADFYDDIFNVEDTEIRARRHEVARRLADE